jgi:putative addiction module component (TIGR02574 family)
MDFKSVLNEVGAWPAEERLRLVEQVWDGLCKQGQAGEADEGLKRLLDRRIESLEQNPDAVVPWETVEARAVERFRR